MPTTERHDDKTPPASNEDAAQALAAGIEQPDGDAGGVMGANAASRVDQAKTSDAGKRQAVASRGSRAGGPRPD